MLKEPDPRIRPGMTATARIATDRVPAMLLAPTEAVFQRDGRPIVYRLRGSMFDETRIDVIRRGREQVAIGCGRERGRQAGDAPARSGSDPEGLVKRRAFSVGRARRSRLRSVGTTLVMAVPAAARSQRPRFRPRGSGADR